MCPPGGKLIYKMQTVLKKKQTENGGKTRSILECDFGRCIFDSYEEIQVLKLMGEKLLKIHFNPWYVRFFRNVELIIFIDYKSIIKVCKILGMNDIALKIMENNCDLSRQKFYY